MIVYEKKYRKNFFHIPNKFFQTDVFYVWFRSTDSPEFFEKLYFDYSNLTWGISRVEFIYWTFRQRQGNSKNSILAVLYGGLQCLWVRHVPGEANWDPSFEMSWQLCGNFQLSSNLARPSADSQGHLYQSDTNWQILFFER